MSWSVWSKLFVTSNLARTELLDELRAGLDISDLISVLALSSYLVVVTGCPSFSLQVVNIVFAYALLMLMAILIFFGQPDHQNLVWL